MWTREQYNPQPINTDGIEVPAEIQPLRTALAKSVHDTWAVTKIEKGEKELAETGSTTLLDHEDLVDFEALIPGHEDYDYKTVDAVLKGILSLGYVIAPAPVVETAPLA